MDKKLKRQLDEVWNGLQRVSRIVEALQSDNKDKQLAQIYRELDQELDETMLALDEAYE